VLIYCLQRALWLAQRLNLSWPHYRHVCSSSKRRPSMRVGPAAGFYVSGAARQVSWASQIWLVLAEVGTAAAAARDHARLEKSARHRHEYTLPAPSHIAALLQCGLRDEAVAEIKAYWGAMVDYGADTFWEIFDPRILTPYGSKLINSYCHAWSCTRPGLFASTDFNNNDKRVIYGRNNVYPVAAAPWLWHCRSLLQPRVADDLSVSDVLLHRRDGPPAYYVGLMFLVTRLVDGVADVLMGLVIDNTATRWGRCRPYLLIGAIPLDCCVFWPSTCRISAPPVS
jgi:hypothetical protein